MKIDNKHTMCHIKHAIRKIPDFPTKGILFYDINSLFEDANIWKSVMAHMGHMLQEVDFDMMIAVESRGFLPTSALSVALHKPFTMVRKPGKLPGAVYTHQYVLEYGTDTLEIQQRVLQPGTKCLIVDDLLATGGTACATAELVQKAGGVVVGFAFILELVGLGGADKCAAIAPPYRLIDFPA